MSSELPPALPLLLLIPTSPPRFCSPRPSPELVWLMMPRRCLPLQPLLISSEPYLAETSPGCQATEVQWEPCNRLDPGQSSPSCKFCCGSSI